MPLRPTRRAGGRRRPAPWTNSGYAAGTLAHSTPFVYGLAREPRMPTMVSRSTVTVRLQVSGQSRGQTLGCVAVAAGVIVGLLPTLSRRLQSEPRRGAMTRSTFRPIDPTTSSRVEQRGKPGREGRPRPRLLVLEVHERLPPALAERPDGLGPAGEVGLGVALVAQPQVAEVRRGHEGGGGGLAVGDAERGVAPAQEVVDVVRVP